MDLVYILQTNISALIVLLIIWACFRKRADLTNKSNRFFLNMIKLNAGILIIDSICVSLYGIPGQTVYFVLSFLSVVYFILNPLPSLYWLIYVHDYLNYSRIGQKKLLILASIPVILNMVLSIGSLWGGYIFYFGPGNEYYRGGLFLLLPFSCYLYMLTAFVIIYKKRDCVTRKKWLALLLFPVLPMVGGILQILHYGLATIWPFISFSLLIVFVYIQYGVMNTDHLTGLYNRREFDYYLDDWIKWKKSNRKVGGFMLDIDDFKNVNDTYGHQIGDEALVEMSGILKSSFRRNDFVARVGGDEFAVVLEVTNPLEIEVIQKRLQENIERFNREQNKPYHLSISFGAGVFEPQKGETIREFFNGLDERMYEEKEKKKLKFA